MAKSDPVTSKQIKLISSLIENNKLYETDAWRDAVSTPAVANSVAKQVKDYHSWPAWMKTATTSSGGRLTRGEASDVIDRIKTMLRLKAEAGS